MPGGPARLPVNMTTLGLIGSGLIGSTVARLAVDAGFDVVQSNSRGPETLGDLVLVSTPLLAYPSLPATELAGKTVLDTGNYYPERDGRIAPLEERSLTDTEYLAQHLRGARVVKVFNNIFFKHLQNLARPADAADRSYLPVAADDGDAKVSVVAFLDAIGYGAVDDGALVESWRQQPGTPVYASPYGEFENEKGTPAGADVIRAALAAATRM